MQILRAIIFWTRLTIKCLWLNFLLALFKSEDAIDALGQYSRACKSKDNEAERLKLREALAKAGVAFRLETSIKIARQCSKCGDDIAKLVFEYANRDQLNNSGARCANPETRSGD